MNFKHVTPRVAILAVTIAFVAWSTCGILSRDTIKFETHFRNTTPINPSSVHAPIFIDGDAALDAFCAGNGTTGLTPATAHVIHDYEIDAAGSGSAIHIQNTTRHLLIQRCMATGAGTGGTDAGILLINCTRVTITGCNASFNGRHGFFLYRNCASIIIANNTATMNQNNGIILFSNCNSNKISGNVVDDNFVMGIYLYSGCELNEIINNTAGNSVSINQDYGIYLADTNNNTVSSNHANDNLVYGIYLSEYCSGNEISYNTACNSGTTNQDVGIKLNVYSNNNRICHNIVNDNFFYGIHFINFCVGNEIDNNTAGNTGTTNQDHGIMLESDCSGNTISRNVANNNMDAGVYLLGGCGSNEIINNTAGNTGTTNQDHGILLESYCDGNTISRNVANNNMDAGVYLFDECGSNEIINNTAGNTGTTNQELGILLESYCDGNTISSNIVNNNMGTGVFLYSHCGSNEIINNTAGNTGTTNQDHGIYLFSACDSNNVSGNIAFDNTFFGICVSSNCDGNLITNNTAGNAGTTNQDHGILLIHDCNNNTISRNIASDNTGSGIHLNTGCDGNEITNNTAGNVGTTNQDHGIYLTDNCSDNTVSCNVAICNNNTGIILQVGCDGNNITRNVVQYNRAGIILNQTCTGNIVYQNRIISNLENAFDNGAGNTWDNGTVGNFWHDYAGVDADGDGIGDTWYPIAGDALAHDKNPLVNVAPRFSSMVVDLTCEIGTGGHAVSWLVTDDWSGLLSYTVSIDGIIMSHGSLNAMPSNITVGVDGLSVGTHVVMAEIVDEYGSKSIDIVMVTVTNTAPSFTVKPGNVSVEAGSMGNFLSWTFSDPSVADCTYSVSRDGLMIITNATCTPGVPVNISIDGLSAGIHVFFIMIDDGYGVRCLDVVYLTVTANDNPMALLSNAIITGLVLLAIIIAVAIVVHGLLVRRDINRKEMLKRVSGSAKGAKHVERDSGKIPASSNGARNP